MLLFSGYATASTASDEALRVTFFLHGGFWKSKYGVANSACETVIGSLRLATDYAAFCEYRRLPDDEGAGHEGTVHDVEQGYAKLMTYLTERNPHREIHPIILGHSAGGTLALNLTASLFDAPLDNILPLHVVALAPVANLELAAKLKVSDNGDAVQIYMGGEVGEVGDRYDAVCPTRNAQRLVKASVSFVVGLNDRVVPMHVVTSCHQAVVSYANRLKIDPPNAKLIMYPDTDHYTLVRAESQAWTLTMSRIMAIFENHQD